MTDKRKRSRNRLGDSGTRHLGLYSVLAVALLLVAYVGVLAYSRAHVSGEKLRLDSFVRLLQDERSKSAEVPPDEDSTITGTYLRRDGSRAK